MVSAIEVPDEAGALVVLARYVGEIVGMHVVPALSPLGGVTASAANEFDPLPAVVVNVAPLGGATWSATASAATITAR